VRHYLRTICEVHLDTMRIAANISPPTAGDGTVGNAQRCNRSYAHHKQKAIAGGGMRPRAGSLGKKFPPQGRRRPSREVAGAYVAKTRGTARQLVGGESPVNGRCYKELPFRVAPS
jgi:hypothetical protein